MRQIHLILITRVLVLLLCSVFIQPPSLLAADGEHHPSNFNGPTAVCDDQVNVSLTSNGQAIVFAGTFDEGSNDPYCLASVKVRRMDQPYAPFGPYVIFDCDDIGSLVAVELKATNCAGYSNTCWSYAMVEDKLPPVIHCPAPQHIPCQQIQNWDMLDQATATDNCGISSLTFVDQNNTNSCGTGVILRTWTAVDLYGKTASCTQTIHVFDNSYITVHFPPDYTTYDCATVADLQPNNLPAPFDKPQVTGGNCKLIATSFEDWVFTAAPPSCVKIIRQWKVLDWCSYNEYTGAGLWTKNQILKIQDTVPPTFTCPDDLVVPTSLTSCLATVNLPQPTDIEDCLPNVQVSIHSDLGPGSTFTGVPIGEYEATYVLTDGCQNASSCKITITVEDRRAPSAICIEGLAIPLMQGGMAEVWASDYETGSSYDNCTPYGDLDFRLGRQPLPGQTVPPSSNVLTFTCDDVGLNIVALWAGDEAGNWGYCLTTAMVQDNRGVCTPPDTSVQMAMMAGWVRDFKGNDIPEVEVRVDSIYWDMTDSLGAYEFSTMPMGQAYTLSPRKDGHPRDGITTRDLLDVARYLMGVDTITNPYQLIAADVDGSGVIDNDDVMAINRLLLGIIPDDLPDSLIWRFVPAAFDFPTDTILLTPPQSIVIDSLNSDVEDAHFIGIRIGDVNGSFMESAGSAQTIGNRSLATAPLLVSDLAVVPGEQIRLPISAGGASIWNGCLLALEHRGLRLLDLEPAAAEGMVFHPSEAGLTMMSWGSAKPLSADGQVLAYLHLEAERAGQLSRMLRLAPNSSAVIGQELTDAAVALHFELAEEQAAPVSLFPNPFRDELFLRFQLPEAEEVHLMIWNASGQLVHEQRGSAQAGAHEWAIGGQRLGPAGLYFYQVSAGSWQHQGRLVRQ